MIEDHFNITATPWTYTEGSAPGYEQTYTAGTAFSGLLDARSRRFVNDRGQMIGVDATFYCLTQSITEKDRLVIGSYTYIIIGLQDPNGLNHHMELLLQRVKA